MLPGNPYRHNALGTFGNADMMLLRQYRFPIEEYDPQLDKFLHRDHDRLWLFDASRTAECLRRYETAFDWTFETWAREISHVQLMSFLIDILKADMGIPWNGYRVLATSNGRGYDIWGLELFFKHPLSETRVISREE